MAQPGPAARLNHFRSRGSTYTGQAAPPHRNIHIAPISRKATTKDSIPRIKSQIIYSLESNFKKLYIDVNSAVSIDKAVQDCLSNLLHDIETKGLQIVPRWRSPSTNRSAVIYFTNTVLPFLRPFLCADQEFLPERDSIALRNLILEKVRASKKSLNEASINNTVNHHLNEAVEIIKYLSRTVEGFPCINISSLSLAQSSPRNESRKYIEEGIFRKFCMALFDLAASYPFFVIAAILMIHGARTAEAAAVRICNIVFGSKFANVSIFCQEKFGKRVSYLKTDQSRRVMVIGEWGTAVILEAMKFLPEGEREVEAETCVLTAVHLNEWIVRQLWDAGISDDSIFLSQNDLLETTPDGQSEKVSSYILRRNFASIARNSMGLSFAEVNAQLGHIGCCDMRKPDVRDTIAQKINRFCFDPRIVPDPWTCPIEYSGMDSIGLNVFSGYKLKNDTMKPITIQINVVAREVEEAICIGYNSKNFFEISASSELTDWSTFDRTVIQDTTLRGDHY